MIEPIIQPVLAAPDVGAILGIVFVILSFLGWIGKLISDSNQPPPPGAGQRPRRPPRPRDNQIEHEIEVFLQEVSGQKPQRGTGRQPRPAGGGQPRGEMSGPPRRTPPRPRPPQQQPQRRSPARGEAPRPRRPSRPEPVAQQTPTPVEFPEAAPVGGGIREHVESYLQKDRFAGAHRDLPHLQSQVASEHLSSSLPMQTTTLATAISSPPGSDEPSTAGAASLARLLSNPAGVRQAILVNEILSRPVALRGR